MTLPSLIRLASALAVLSAPTSAGAAHAAGVQPTSAWSRPAAPGLQVGVAYLTLLNHSRVADRLIGADSPKAARVSLHRSSMAGGVMTMQAMPGGLDLPPGRSVALAPGGYHLMLEGLRSGLKAGDHYPLTVRFAHSPPRTVQVEVRPASPMAGMN